MEKNIFFLEIFFCRLIFVSGKKNVKVLEYRKGATVQVFVKKFVVDVVDVDIDIVVDVVDVDIVVVDVVDVDVVDIDVVVDVLMLLLLLLCC